MNCFQHADKVAVVFCKECNKALCRDCARLNILSQTHVCSEVCAKLVSWRPKPEAEEEGSLFQRIYASAFLTVFMTLLLAILGGAFVSCSAQRAMEKEKRRERGEYLSRKASRRANPMAVFYQLGVTDWRA